MGLNAYRRAAMGVPGKTQGSIFFSVPCEVCSYSAGKVAVKEMVAGRRVRDKTLSLGTDLEQVLRSTEKMLEVLQRITDYVDDVLAGRIAADSSVGRLLFDVVASVPSVDPEQFESMVTSGMEDLLMIVYLANITQAQLSLGEKLTSIL
jgi:translation initiation factor 3 subunit F